MELFKQLDANHKSVEDNWKILNKLEKQITVRRSSANVTVLTGEIVFYLYAIWAIYALFAAPFMELFKDTEEYGALLTALPVKSLFQLLPLPWYADILAVVAGLFVIPWVMALFGRIVTQIVCSVVIPEKKKQLPSNQLERNKTIALRTKTLYHKQYNSTGPNTSIWANYIASALFDITPAVALVCMDETRLLLEEVVTTTLSQVPAALGWGIVVVALILIMLIPSFIFSYVFLGLELTFNKILKPLYFPKNWHPRCRALDEAEKVFYQRWIAVDAAEQKKDAQRKKAKQEQWEEEKRKKEEFRKTMAQAYVRQQKEHQEYLDRLHKWANEDDTVHHGIGDGI